MNGASTFGWRVPLALDRLQALLEELIAVAGQDPGHDMSTIFDAYNEQRAREGKPLLSVEDYLQLAHVVRVGIAGEPSGGQMNSDLVFLNRHLHSVRAPLKSAPTAYQAVLPHLLRETALVVSGKLPPLSGGLGGVS